MFAADTIVAFDPGTKLGWAVFARAANSDGYERLSSGVLDLGGKPWGERFDAAADFVHSTIEASWRPGELLAVTYENIQARTLRSYDNMRVTTGIITAVYQGVHRCGLDESVIFPVPLASVKLHATGNGKASKKQMRDAFVSRYGAEPSTDDEADAAHMASYCGAVLAGDVKRPNTVVWRRLAKHYEG